MLDNILELKRVMLYAAPAEHSPTPYTIAENLNVVEIITDGLVFFEQNNIKHSYRKGTIFWHVPGDKTVFDTTRESPYRCIVFHIAVNSPQRIAPRVSSWRGSPESFEDFIQQSYSAFFACRSNAGEAAIVSNYCLSEILMHALELKKLHGQPLIEQENFSGELVLRKVINYIENNLAGDLSSNALSETLKIPRNKLFTLFSRYMNITPANYISEKRLEQARKLLESSALPIKEIAALCGFEHVEVFHRSFYKHLGDTPKNYRLKARPYQNISANETI